MYTWNVCCLTLVSRQHTHTHTRARVACIHTLVSHTHTHSLHTRTPHTHTHTQPAYTHAPEHIRTPSHVHRRLNRATHTHTHTKHMHTHICAKEWPDAVVRRQDATIPSPCACMYTCMRVRVCASSIWMFRQ